MIKYNSNFELCKKLEVSNFKNMTVISETPISWGYPPVYPLSGVLPLPGSYMIKSIKNDELCKKLEVSISKNATIILQKPIFRGVTPQFTPLGGSDHGATSEYG